jgi:hypothetical protein
VVAVLAVFVGLLSILSAFLIIKIIRARKKNNPSMIVTADINRPLRDEDM